VKSTDPLTGKLLAAEKNVRRTLIDNCDRDQLIAAIAAHLCRANSVRQGLGGFAPRCTPREWYAMPVS